MQGTLVMWVMLVASATIISIATGIYRPTVKNAEKLKSFEVKQGYKCNFIYRGRPTALVTWRFDQKISCVSIAIVLLVAWNTFIFGGVLDAVCLRVWGDNLFWHRLAILTTSLLVHVAIWVALSRNSYFASISRLHSLKRDLESRGAVVKVI